MNGAELSEYEIFGFELRGSKGIIRLEGEKALLFQAEEYMHEPDSGFCWGTLKPREVDHPRPNSIYTSALNELLDALEGKGTSRSDDQVGRRSLEMVMAIYESQLNDCSPVQFPISMKESGFVDNKDAFRVA